MSTHLHSRRERRKPWLLQDGPPLTNGGWIAFGILTLNGLIHWIGALVDFIR